MGSQAFDDTIQAVSTGSMLSGAASFLIVVGGLGMVIGCYGAFVARFRAEAHLSRHVKVLCVLVLVWLCSCAVGLVMYLQSTNWRSSRNTFMKSSQIAYAESFGQRMCPIALGYLCHAAKMNISVESSQAIQGLLIPSLPLGPWRVNSYGSFGVNETVATAFSNQPRNSGYFVDLCATVASRVQALGPAKRLASELQRACSVCRVVAPVQELPTWIKTSGSMIYEYRVPYVYAGRGGTEVCLDLLFPSEWTQLMRQNGIPGSANSYRLFSSDFFNSWSDYSMAIFVSSGMMAATTAVLAFEARRSLQELFPPPR